MKNRLQNRFTQIIFCGVTLLISLVACADSQEPMQAYDPNAVHILDRVFSEAEIAQGQATYAQYCAACHGGNAQGQFPEAPLEPDITGKIGAPPHNDTGHSWHHSDVVLLRYVADGGFSDLTRFYVMPPFATILTEDQRMQVVAYIKTLWTVEQRQMQYQLTQDEQRLFLND